MATRVRTRISFGAFANFKNNLQNQIGLNTIITSIKKLISTYNNNFVYIVNSFNLFLQIKYGKDPILIEDKESKTNNITFQPESDTAINYTEMLDKIEQLNKRVDNIEKIMNSGEAAALVTPGIKFYFRDYDINCLDGYNNFGIGIVFNYPITGSLNHIAPIFIENKDENGLCYDFGIDQVSYIANQDTLIYNGMYVERLHNGFRYYVGNNKYFSNDIQVIKGTVVDISLGKVNIFQNILPLKNISRQCGYLELCMRLDGTIEEFDESYKELKNGETLVL